MDLPKRTPLDVGDFPIRIGRPPDMKRVVYSTGFTTNLITMDGLVTAAVFTAGRLLTPGLVLWIQCDTIDASHGPESFYVRGKFHFVSGDGDGYANVPLHGVDWNSKELSADPATGGPGAEVPTHPIKGG